MLAIFSAIITDKIKEMLLQTGAGLLEWNENKKLQTNLKKIKSLQAWIKSSIYNKY